jgi:hypothetical protein
MGKRSRRRTNGEPAPEGRPEASAPPTEERPADGGAEAGESSPPRGQPAGPSGAESAPPRGQPAGPASAPLRSDPTGRAAWILLETYRWVVQRAEAPGPEVWDDQPEFPSSREVEELFGSWEQLWEAAGLYDAPYFKALDEADAEHDDLATRRDATEREAARLRDEAERREAQMRELRRQAERAREKADRERAELQAANARAEAAERRAVEAERRAAAAADATPGDAGPAPEVPPDWLAEHEALLAARDDAERHGEALARQLDQALEELEERDRALVELRRALATGEGDEDAEAGDRAGAAEPPPATVLEAVERAAQRAQHLRFAPRAFESAAESPFSRPQLILDNLMRLDELAAAYLQGDLGERLADVAFRMRLAWRGGISERTRTRYGRDYDFAYDGGTLQLGPHVRIGSGTGAGAIARIYLHLHPGDDRLERSVIVGHVGRHLPDSTT